MKSNCPIYLIVFALTAGCAGTRKQGETECLNRLNELQGQMDEMRHDLEGEMRLSQVLEDRRIAIQEIGNQLVEAADQAEAEVEAMKERIVIRVPSRVLFAFGATDLTEQGRSALTSLAIALKAIPEGDFLVAGHTDNVPVSQKNPDYESNLELSLHRALSVVELLIDYDIDRARLGVAGFGEFHPVADNGTEAGRILNRRIEIIIMPMPKTVPDVSEKLTPIRSERH